eukprot:GHVU01020116.1.p1 GENE.GHVU01020116.1~~GHVU01020116.1.p1  ORF type:complete len:253 (-),score=38.61 GHVU01020116.1:97-855(-)
MHKVLIFTFLLFGLVASQSSTHLHNLGKAKFGEKPIAEYKLHMVDIHWLSGRLNQQYIAHHFCAFPYDGFMICDLFSSADKNARPIGIEYFITRDRFDALPEEEKVLWHSHPYEILSGLFVVMDVTPEEEEAVLEWVMGTYGKVTDTWQFYNDMPIGAPQLGFALALDSQVDWDLADEMDKSLNLPTTHKQRRAARMHMKMPDKAPGSDAYLKTKQAPQYEIGFIEMKDVETIDGSLVKKVIGKVEKVIEDL